MIKRRMVFLQEKKLPIARAYIELHLFEFNIN